MVFLLFVVVAFSYPLGELPVGVFRAAGPGDARSPCPGLNTLANHGFINRNGRNIAASDLIAAAQNVYNLSPSIVQIAVTNANLIDNIFPNGVMSGLDILNTTHNLIEHDASMSRSDKYLGDYIRPNATLIAQFVPNVNAIFTRSDIANARRNRINDSRARNPTFTFGVTSQEPVAAAESAFLHTIFGNNGNIPAKYLKFFLMNEQLPTSLGWTKSPDEIGQVTFIALTAYYTAQELMLKNPRLSKLEATTLAKKLVSKWANPTK